MPSWGLLKLSCRPLAFRGLELVWRGLKRSEEEVVWRGLELVSLPYFLHNFWGKIFILIYSINWSSFIVWLSLLREILGNMCMSLNTICDSLFVTYLKRQYLTKVGKMMLYISGTVLENHVLDSSYFVKKIFFQMICLNYKVHIMLVCWSFFF